ncbi:bucentaur or craniofacial development-domain-containing protein [Lasiosphaeria miniovina]|uniref:SWR1-complex protein 5 n=1 Tax=Lasiosphaeria miniovina TaxID=1954250 RepID=A0AA40A4M3_9PEZI|nr:bucentaur or craniofacial development-domain-containing protein [Lasiosphaeria miniovina]KAK0709110.1 bucentaur or craniofacial development-domain-containing protein [Lasiosphaeria miniovina]
MPPAIDPEESDDYASEEDTDFNVDGSPKNYSSGSEDEVDDEAAPSGKSTAPIKRQRQAGDGDGEAEDAGFENSGDEAIIQKGKKSRKKRKANDGAAVDDDDGGDGGLIKTRSMRAAEKIERKTAAVSGPVTVDVEALWTQMIGSSTTHPQPSEQQGGSRVDATAVEPANDDTLKVPAAPQLVAPGEAGKQADLIRIKRTYNFAGKVHTEEKLVPRDSAEARLYLASLGENGNAEAILAESLSSPKRMPKKAFRSAFEPIIIDQSLQRSDLNLGMSVRLRARDLANEASAKKLNTVEKSRMDWAGFVDKEGIKDELDLAGKSKDSFAARQDFLARSEAKRDEDARRARLAGQT